MKIIVVDDEVTALNTFLYNILNRQDISAQMFLDDPEGAIKYAVNNKVDAAFLDIMMPKMNGIDLAKRLIKELPGIKIYLITAFTFDEVETSETLGRNFAGYCYKPYDKSILERQLMLLKESIDLKAERKVFIKTFDAFDVFLNGIPLIFRGAKSKELLAFAVNKNGCEATMEEVVTALWPNKTEDVGKISYRDSVWKLRRTLNENGLDSLMNFQRGRIKINKEGVTCDMWDVIDGKSPITSIVSYMPNYEWSADYEAEIMDRLEEKMKNNG